jgi:hypothetical protein
MSDLEQRVGHDLAVVHQDDQVRTERLDVLDALRGSKATGGQDRTDAELRSGNGDRRGNKSLGTAGGACRSCHHADKVDDAMVEDVEPHERFDAELTAPDEDGADPSAGHASAGVRSSISSVSSSREPTASNSSIESR